MYGEFRKLYEKYDVKEMLEGVKVGDEVLRTYCHEKLIVTVEDVTADKIIVKVPDAYSTNIKPQLQTYNKEGDSIDGLKSIIRAFPEHAFLAIKLTLLREEDWATLGKEELKSILNKIQKA